MGGGGRKGKTHRDNDSGDPDKGREETDGEPDLLRGAGVQFLACNGLGRRRGGWWLVAPRYDLGVAARTAKAFSTSWTGLRGKGKWPHRRPRFDSL